MANSPAPAASPGTIDETGVVLRAIDEFSENIQKYLAALRRVQQQQQGLGDEERRAAGGADDRGRKFELNAARMAKYGTAVSAMSGQLAGLGPAGQIASRGAMLVGEAVSGMMGPIGAAVVVMGALTSGMIAMMRYKSQQEDQARKSGEAFLMQAEKTGLLSKAEEARTRVLLAQARAELITAQAKQAKLAAETVELNNQEQLMVGAAQTIALLLGASGARLGLAMAAGSMAGAIARENAEFDNLSIQIRETLRLIEAAENALAGGTDKINQQREALEKYNAAVAQHNQRLAAMEQRRLQTLAAIAAAEARMYDARAEEGLAATIRAHEISAQYEMQAAVERAEREKASVAATVLTEQQKAAEILAIESQLALERLQIQQNLEQQKLDLTNSYAMLQINAWRQEMDEEKRLADAARAKREADDLRAAQKVIGVSKTIGSAIGRTAAGAAYAWRDAGIQMIEFAKREAEAYILLQIKKAIASGNWAQAALAGASLAAVEAIASKAISDLEGSRSVGGDGGGTTGRSGPRIHVPTGFEWGPASPGVARASALAGGGASIQDNSRAELTIVIQGDVQPEQAARWEEDAQRWLDRNMPRWQERRRMSGART